MPPTPYPRDTRTIPKPPFSSRRWERPGLGDVVVRTTEDGKIRTTEDGTILIEE